ncbi:MAG TPA: hypothetical protein PLJ27_22780 [Polyangiaceae bacterium]|nr:hypothetical protein [Polyangiaceae bacterium]
MRDGDSSQDALLPGWDGRPRIVGCALLGKEALSRDATDCRHISIRGA